MDTHVDPPLKRRKPDDENVIYDRYNQKMSFYADVPRILVELKDKSEVTVAIASRTSAPRAWVSRFKQRRARSPFQLDQE